MKKTTMKTTTSASSPIALVSSVVIAAILALGVSNCAGSDPLSSVDPSSKPGGDDGAPGAGRDSTSPSKVPGGGEGEGNGGDPFAPQPDESEGLTNVSADLDALLERGALEGACARYRGGATDKKTMLMCGKWMFFYETFNTSGVPAVLVKFLANNFPDELGLGFSKLGMVLDPRSIDKLPLGLAKTAPMAGDIEAVAFTCASCHFGQLPDKRYAVGAPNHAYEYGKHILTITLAPTLGLGMGASASASDHDTAAVAMVQPVLDKLSGDFALKAKFGLALLPLASANRPVMTKEIERQYATWPAGTLDFVIAPLPVDDKVHVVGKMMGLWGMPRPKEIASSGMSNALLAWTGGTTTLDEFLRGFALFGGAPAPSAATLQPLLEYLYSLRAPQNPNPSPPDAVARGAKLFVDKGCSACHSGPRGSGKRSYTFAEIGTDKALAGWLDPNLSGSACCGVDMQSNTLTHGVKSPRLVGLWAMKRFLHNGALGSLDELLCATPRPSAVGQEPLRTDGHDFGCKELSADEKKSLLSYLLEH